jgi:hypothetical protein
MATMDKQSSKKSYKVIVLLAAAICIVPQISLAQDSGSEAKSFERFFALPVEIDSDHGATNGDATIYRLMPLYGRPSKENWKIIHLDLLMFADTPGGIPGQPGNPDSEPGQRVFGFGDWIHAAFYTPPSAGNPVLVVVAMVSIPTATDKRLGSGKWTAGPAFRFSYKTGHWNLGFFGGQRWSFAGSDNRKAVSQLMIRGTVRRTLPNNWYFVSAPIITANWNRPEKKWLVPLGGGIGKVYRIGSNPWAFSLQGYYNVIKPDGAPDWSVRFSVVAAIPLGK